MSRPEDTACPCCKSGDLDQLGRLPSSRWFAGKHLDTAMPGGCLYRCRRCRLKFRHPVHDADMYRHLYDNATVATWAENAARPDWDLVTGHIRDHLRPGQRILDVGCYSGGLLRRFAGHYEGNGVEINRVAARIAATRTNGNIWPSVDDVPRDSRFDAVILADVIEHMVDPMEIIKNIALLLADDGVIIMTTGDAENALWNRFGANWWYCFYPEHIAFISSAWLGFLCRETGLSLVRCETFRYTRYGVFRRAADWLLAHLYGCFPAVYLHFGGIIRKLLSRRHVSSVPGNGVSSDHLFIVLAKNASP